MKILVISEHFLPRIAGTTEYVIQICSALSAFGHDLHLLIPGESREDEIVEGFPFSITALGVKWPSNKDPDRSVRYRFCERVSDLAATSAQQKEYDILHVLFGLFVAEKLPATQISKLGLPTVLTVHNVPPHECARSWEGDAIVKRIQDSARLKLVSFKNRLRLRKQAFDAYVVPSTPVQKLLHEITKSVSTVVIPHGYDNSLVDVTNVPLKESPQSSEPYQLLTVGGWMPHKRQHLIPSIAARLKASGIKFLWNIAGPPRRCSRYEASIKQEIERLNVANEIRILGPVSDEHLVELYREAHLYIQPSKEEGFCITALNAAASGIPVIGCSAGAIPEICEISGGSLSEGTSEAIFDSIRFRLNQNNRDESALKISSRVRNQYSWAISAEKLVGVYQDLLSDILNPTANQ